MKKGLRLIVFLFLTIFTVNLISAAIQDDLHLNIQVRDTSGNIITGTFNFTFNISTSSDCDGSFLYSNTTTKTTDSRGIISHYLPDFGSLNFTDQYYLCYYRDDILKSNSRLARVPYSFNSKFLQGSLRNAFAPFNKSWVGNFNIAGSLFINGIDALNGSSEDSIPLGTIISYNGTTCPQGFSSLESAKGRYIVGLQDSGTLEGTVGTAFTTDLESRIVGQHLHADGSLSVSTAWTGSVDTAVSGSVGGSDGTHTHTMSHGDVLVSSFGAVGSASSGRAIGAQDKSVLSATTTGSGHGHGFNLALSSGTVSGSLTSGTVTGSTANSGSVAGTNAPYIQYLTCIKTSTVDLTQGWNQDGSSIWVADTTLNVGIGTTSPSYRLDVGGSSPSIMINDTSGSTSFLRFAHTTANTLNYIALGGSNKMFWKVNGTDVIVLDGSGNVGIGTSSPIKKLEVYESTALGSTANNEEVIAWFTGNDGSGGKQGLRISSRRFTAGSDVDTIVVRFAWAPGIGAANSNGGRTWFEMGNIVENSLSNQVFRWGVNAQEGTDGTEFMRITANGRVAIAGGGASLQLNGLPSRSGSLTLCYGASGDFYINDIGFCSSLRELKKNIINLTISTEDLMKLIPREFNWKVDDSSDVGFIAEEVFEVNPSLATYYNNSLGGVNYNALVSLLVKNAQEQQIIIKSQQSQVDLLKSELCQKDTTYSWC